MNYNKPILRGNYSVELYIRCTHPLKRREITTPKSALLHNTTYTSETSAFRRFNSDYVGDCSSVIKRAIAYGSDDLFQQQIHYSPPQQGKECKYAGESVRALPIRIVTLGKKRSPGVQLIVDDYIHKLKHYCSVEDVRLKSNPKTARDAMAQIEHEDVAVMGIIKSNEWVVMMDERGISLGSEKMASLIGDAGNTGASSIVFCIGGPYGHGRQLRERANVSVKLSSLVLNHEIALVVLVEQLYRAWTILKGQKYHH